MPFVNLSCWAFLKWLPPSTMWAGPLIFLWPPGMSELSHTFEFGFMLCILSTFHVSSQRQTLARAQTTRIDIDRSQPIPSSCRTFLPTALSRSGIPLRQTQLLPAALTPSRHASARPAPTKLALRPPHLQQATGLDARASRVK